MCSRRLWNSGGRPLKLTVRQHDTPPEFPWQLVDSGSPVSTYVQMLYDLQRWYASKERFSPSRYSAAGFLSLLTSLCLLSVALLLRILVLGRFDTFPILSIDLLAVGLVLCLYLANLALARRFESPSTVTGGPASFPRSVKLYIVTTVLLVSALFLVIARSRGNAV
jgi:hypothetical protein